MENKTRSYLLGLFSIIWICKPISYQEVAYHKYNHQQIVVSVNRGGGSPSESQEKIKITKGFHRRLEQHFPDWEGRMDYQKRQEKYYKLAMRKKMELKRTKLSDKEYYYTKEELDAISYFRGTGFYKKQQDPKVHPNIFDTRQSFLRKMHDPIARKKFLDSLNNKHISIDNKN